MDCQPQTHRSSQSPTDLFNVPELFPLLSPSLGMRLTLCTFIDCLQVCPAPPPIMQAAELQRGKREGRGYITSVELRTKCLNDVSLGTNKVTSLPGLLIAYSTAREEKARQCLLRLVDECTVISGQLEVLHSFLPLVVQPCSQARLVLQELIECISRLCPHGGGAVYLCTLV